MRWLIFAAWIALGVSCVTQAHEVITVTTVVSAQESAEQMARTGVLRHCGRTGGRREGIGFSSSSADAAVRACCYYQDAMRGRYRIVEKGVARGPRG